MAKMARIVRCEISVHIIALDLAFRFSAILKLNRHFGFTVSQSRNSAGGAAHRELAWCRGTCRYVRTSAIHPMAIAIQVELH